MKLVDRRLISPPVNSVAATKIPLSFLDIVWLGSKPVQRIFLYKLPSITPSNFIQNILPNLQHSLSLALIHFFPVAGSLFLEPGSRPYIRYDPGNSVVLSVFQTDKANFEKYVTREQGKVIEYALLTELVPTLSKDDETTNDPLFAIQVTVFPNSGLCMGISYKHVLGDGRSIMQFLTTWAALCRNSGTMFEDCVLPAIDRSIIPDTDGVLVDTFLKKLANIPPEFLKKNEQLDVNEVKVSAKFYLNRIELQNMKMWILSEVDDVEKLHLSSFVMTCSLIWICLIKSQTVTKHKNDDDDDKHSIFGFVLDCCDRYEYKSIVPVTYFGNCLCLECFTSVKRHDLYGETGFLTAVKAIGKAIEDIVAKGPMKDVEKWFTKPLENIKSIYDVIGVAGSPRLRVYDLDFGWGKVEKVEVVSIVDPMAVSLAEFKDDVGGVEAGLVLEKFRMEAFIGLFEESKAKYCVNRS